MEIKLLVEASKQHHMHLCDSLGLSNEYEYYLNGLSNVVCLFQQYILHK
jgi:hypothetical protein